MPRYFCHVLDGYGIIDGEQTELPDFREARAEVIWTARAILRDKGDEFWTNTEWQMTVTDASGRSVLKLRFLADEQGLAPA